MIKAAISVLTAAVLMTSPSVGENKIPEGWLVWHSYTDYSSMDSRLYVKSPDGEITEICGDFTAPMNGFFGKTPDKITFMAIDTKADEWDIYVYDDEDKTVVNLTPYSGYRNEDPKWSPDGRSIVFKRGHWDSSVNDFVYELALLDVESGSVSMLTDSRAEEAMPCFSDDGKYIYYTEYNGGIGSIRRMDTVNFRSETVYSEEGVTAYYPIEKNEIVYFAKWHGIDNHHDMIMCSGESGFVSMEFNSDDYDCSDVCPVDGDTVIFSSTMNGSYDLFCFDGDKTVPFTALNSDINELGADFYSMEEYRNFLAAQNSPSGDVNADGDFNAADIVMLQKWIHGSIGELSDWKSGDLCPDGRIDIFDVSCMRKRLLSQLS